MQLQFFTMTRCFVSIIFNLFVLLVTIRNLLEDRLLVLVQEKNNYVIWCNICRKNEIFAQRCMSFSKKDWPFDGVIKNSICSTRTNFYSYSEIIFYAFTGVARIADEMRAVVKYKRQKGVRQQRFSGITKHRK